VPTIIWKRLTQEPICSGQAARIICMYISSRNVCREPEKSFDERPESKMSSCSLGASCIPSRTKAAAVDAIMKSFPDMQTRASIWSGVGCQGGGASSGSARCTASLDRRESRYSRISASTTDCSISCRQNSSWFLYSASAFRMCRSGRVVMRTLSCRNW